MDAAKIVELGQKLSPMTPALGGELVRVGGEMQSGRMEQNEASKQLYKAIDKEIRRVRAYDITGHSAAQVQQLADVRIKIAQGVLKANWQVSFPVFKQMWQSAQKEMALPRFLMRIVSICHDNKKVKLFCHIAAATIGSAVFVGKLMRNVDARQKAGQVLRQTTEVAKGYAIKFCETAKTVAKKAIEKVSVAVVAYKVATEMRSATKALAGTIASGVRKPVLFIR